jgi:hypothetical protein
MERGCKSQMWTGKTTRLVSYGKLMEVDVSLDKGRWVVDGVLGSVDCVRVLPFLVGALAYPCGPCIHSEILIHQIVRPGVNQCG